MYYELVYSKRCKKFYYKICFAPTCVREEPIKVHSSISILEPVTTGWKIQTG